MAGAVVRFPLLNSEIYITYSRQAAGTASVVVGSMWALGSFGGHFFAPGRAAFGAAGGLWAAAHAGSPVHLILTALCP